MGYQDYERFGPDRKYGYRAGQESGERGSAGRYGRERWEGREDRDRSWSDEDRYDREDRGFFERAGDEVRSWFGDDEAERRRRQEREYGRDRWREAREEGRGGGYVGGYSESTGGFFRGDRAAEYGAGRGAGATGMWGLGAGRDRELWGHDPYRAWRERQMLEFDRDYDEYRREHQSKFDRDFGTWREERQRQRSTLRGVQLHQEVVGSDGQHVGTVDRVQGDRILLTRSDPDAGGHHHSIPCSWIQTVGDRVELNRTADEARRAWRDEEDRSFFLGEEGRERIEGPHYLSRSFSGTY